MAWTDLPTVHTPSAGTRPPASWGSAVNDNMAELYTHLISKTGAWTSYSPVLVQFGAVAKSTVYSRYLKIGRMVVCQGYLTVTGSGTSSNKVTVSLPFTAAQGSLVVGSFYVYDASVNTNYIGHGALDSTSTITGIISGTSNYMGAGGFTAGLASSDSVLWNAVYEATS